ncbi:MAG: sigma-54-dependent transcriptional regulator [Thermoanaerobaculales bacterium]
MTAQPLSVLVVDDDNVFRGVLTRELRASGFRVEALPRGEDVEAALRTDTFDVVVLDLKMPGMGGLATLETIKKARPLVEVVLLTGHGSVESAVEALKLGAFDFLQKPCDLDHLESVIQRAAQARSMRSANEALRHDVSRRADHDDLIGDSEAIRHVRSLIEKVAPTNSTVLIHGESGTGKEVVARAIHRLNARHDRPFVVLDCAATEVNLALSELFGHERGAYTGATGRKHGLFELADSGAILVDEIGDAPLALQTSLLRVIETGAFYRVGGERPIRVDVRILAATHRNLANLVREGRFRQDLFYRLDVFTIEVPALRERVEDIPALVAHFLTRLRPRAVPAVEPEAMATLMAYPWPGNVRELRNVIERGLILAQNGAIRPEHLPANFAMEPAVAAGWAGDQPPSLNAVELRYLQALLDRFGGHRGKVAAALGISERTLYRKLRGIKTGRT